jgi:transcriptional regulator with XRE-family HTH domain
MNNMAGTLRLRVPELLKERGWGPMDLIRRSEFSFAPSTAYRLARGEGSGYKMETLAKLADGFGVSIEELFERQEDGS